MPQLCRLRDACTLKFNSNPDFLGTKTAIAMSSNSGKKAKKKKKKKKSSDDEEDDNYVADPDEVDDGEDYVADNNDDDEEAGGSDYQLKTKKKKPATKGKAKARAAPVKARAAAAGGGKAVAGKAKSLDSKEEYMDATVLEEQAKCTDQKYKTNPDNGWTFCSYAESQGYMARMTNSPVFKSKLVFYNNFLEGGGVQQGFSHICKFGLFSCW